MKQIKNSFKLIAILALMALATSCASNMQNKENLLVAAGFRVITPTTPAQQQKLQTLPAGKVTLVKKSGKTYYVFPDAKNNQAYVGGPKQYQAYKQLRLQQQMSNENLEAAEMNQNAAMGWEAWGGWGGWGDYGWY